MTPTATTPAGPTARTSRNGAGEAPGGHPRKLHQQLPPRAPRRVSGPAGGATRTTPRPQPAPGLRASAGGGGLRAPSVVRTRALVGSLPDHALIDRLVRGRAWILALGVMLAGIVAMQVEILKLGASIGRSVQRTAALSIRNEQLQASVASLADDQRIEKLAAGMGMVMSPPNAVGFLAASSNGNLQSALSNLQAPSATSFLNSTSTNGIVVTPTALAAANAPTSSSAGATLSGPTATATPTAASTPTTASAPTAAPGLTGAAAATGAASSTAAAGVTASSGG